jgi:tetratricopeptide (TPR) repeat protein
LGNYWWVNRFMVIKMRELRFKDITDSLAEGFDPNVREELFSKLEGLKTDDEALKGIQFFVQKHGRDYELMRNTFKSFNELLDSKEKNTKKINLSWLKYAAALVVVLGLSFYYFKSKSIDLTAFEYKDAGLPVLMGSEGNIVFNNGMSAFKMKDYHKAYEEFSKCENSDTVYFYQGMCAYMGEDYKKALYHMNEVPLQSVFYGKSLYINSLSNLHLGNKEDAKLTLQLILLTESEFKNRAKELIENLN